MTYLHTSCKGTYDVVCNHLWYDLDIVRDSYWWILLKKGLWWYNQSSCRWFEIQWRSLDVIVSYLVRVIKSFYIYASPNVLTYQYCKKVIIPIYVLALQWRQNKRDDVANQQPQHCLLNRLFRRRSKKTSELRVTGRWIPCTKGQ